MANDDSRRTGGQEPAAQPREQVAAQRQAEEGVAGGGAGRNRGPGQGFAPTGDRPGQGAGAPQGGTVQSEPDVYLQVPRLNVEQIYLEVDNLDAHVSLRARLSNLLQLDVGVQAHLGTVKLDIKGVEAEALLEVRLEEVHRILDRALSTIDRNPQILETLVKAVDTPVNQVGHTAQQALGPHGPLSRTLDRVGPTAQQALEPQGPPSQTLQQGAKQVGQQLGKATEQGGQQLNQKTEQAEGAAVGDGTGIGGVSAGSSARAAWQRMKKILNDSQPLRQVTARLIGPPRQGQQHGS